MIPVRVSCLQKMLTMSKFSFKSVCPAKSLNLRPYLATFWTIARRNPDWVSLGVCDAASPQETSFNCIRPF